MPTAEELIAELRASDASEESILAVLAGLQYASASGQMIEYLSHQRVWTIGQMASIGEAMEPFEYAITLLIAASGNEALTEDVDLIVRTLGVILYSEPEGLAPFVSLAKRVNETLRQKFTQHERN